MSWAIFCDGALFFSLLFSFVMTYYTIPLCIKLSKRFNIVDIPDGTIKTHKSPTPYLGGLAVYIGFLSGIAFTLPLENRIILFLIGATFLLLLGLLDDLVALRPYQKFLGQIIAAACFLKGGFYLKEHVFYYKYGPPLSFLWMLTVINAFNLIDVMDGLASTVGSCIIFMLFCVGLLIANSVVLVILAALFGALAAFFLYNKPPAKIYLGDTGSLFLGGILSSLPFLFNWGTYYEYGCFALLIIYAIPLLEVTCLVFIRTYKGIPFYYGSRDHFACYLKDKGWYIPQILGLTVMLSCMLCCASYLVVLGEISPQTTGFFAFLFLIFWSKIYV